MTNFYNTEAANRIMERIKDGMTVDEAMEQETPVKITPNFYPNLTDLMFQLGDVEDAISSLEDKLTAAKRVAYDLGEYATILSENPLARHNPKTAQVIRAIKTCVKNFEALDAIALSDWKETLQITHEDVGDMVESINKQLGY